MTVASVILDLDGCWAPRFELYPRHTTLSASPPYPCEKKYSILVVIDWECVFFSFVCHVI